jgi:hypothetical protein
VEHFRSRLREQPDRTDHAGYAAQVVHDLDACLDALEQVDRNANLGLVIQNWCEELAGAGAIA